MAVILPNGKNGFVTSAGVPLVGGKLFTYDTGTSNPRPTYADAGKVGANANPIILDGRGEALIYWDGVYRIILQDSTGASIWPAIDNVGAQPSNFISSLLPGTTNAYDIGSPTFSWRNLYLGPNGAPVLDSVSGNFGYYARTAAESVAGVTPVNFVYAPGVVDRYGTNTTPGTTDMTAAWNAAIAQASQTGGAEVTANGIYLVGNLTVNANGIKIRGSGMGLTQLKANANGIWVLKIAQSNCVLESILIDGNGHTNVDGLVIAPANEAITNATSQQNFNIFRAVQTQNCNNGLRMRAGPTVTGTDSGCFYNTFFGCFWLNCVRTVWMQDAVNVGAGAPNRCGFHGCRGGIQGAGGCNTGLQIDAGGTNAFYGLHFEGISQGTSPSAIPTAVVIANFAASGAQNIDNHFFGCFLEANTQDWNNHSATTQIFGGITFATKFAAGMTNPSVLLTGDPSIAPFILPGMQNGQGLAGYPSGYWGMSEEIADTGKQWQAYALTTTTVSNTATVVNATSNYRQLANVVEWAGVCQFNASVAGTQVNITPPVAPNTAQYTALFTNAPFYTFSVNNGASIVQVAGGWTSTGKLYFAVPSGNWNTAGNNNAITFQVSYHT